MKFSFYSTVLLALLPAFAVTAVAKNNADRTQFNRDIRLQAGEAAGELTCINCSIYVYGAASGDATAIHGNVVVEQGGSISGDATTVLGDIRVEPSASVGGDATSVGGSLRRQAGATIGGDVTAIEGRFGVILLLASPFVVFGMIVALIVWLVQRSRHRAVVAA
jgi:hypothetical protein